MKKKIKEFIKTNWFKLGILVILLLLVVLVFCYFVFIQQKENNKVEDGLSKLPPAPVGQKGYTLDELKTLTSNIQKTSIVNGVDTQKKKDFWDWMYKSGAIRTQLSNILKNRKNIDSDINYTDTLNIYKSQVDQLSIQISDLTIPDVPFVETLVENKNLVSRLADDISIWCFDKQKELDAKKTGNNDLSEFIKEQVIVDINKITQDLNSITDNLNYITAYVTKYNL